MRSAINTGMTIAGPKQSMGDSIDFTEDLASAFSKRNRALSRRGAQPSLKRVEEALGGGEAVRKRLEVSINYRVDGAPVVLRVHAWSDRWVWVDARRGSKSGWIWAITSEGRFIDKRGVRGLVETVEQMLNVVRDSPAVVEAKIESLWKKSLARGPTRVS